MQNFIKFYVKLAKFTLHRSDAVPIRPVKLLSNPRLSSKAAGVKSSVRLKSNSTRGSLWFLHLLGQESGEPDIADR